MGNRDGQPNRSTADEAELARRLKALEQRLGAQRPGAGGGNIANPASSGRAGIGLALRLAVDLVAGVLLGGALGWGFDRLFGTSPWGLMVLLLLGFIAGTLNVLRSAGMVKQGPLGPRDQPPEA
jgi:ATP synthase protein I